MKKIFPALLVLSVMTNGCSYRGAVYSEYTDVGIGVKGSAASNSPVKAHLGYDHAVIAYVPKRTDQGTRHEVVSVISRNDVYAKVPTPADKLVTNKTSLLKVDAAFIAGNAAIIATVPEGRTVVLLPETPDTSAALRFKTTGSNRVANALVAEFGPDDNTAIIEKWLAEDGGKLTGPHHVQAKKWLEGKGLEIPNLEFDSNRGALRQRFVDEVIASR